ncbi:hypothetical protein LR48_Vigan09g122100 [Vigna angularis]|uniref:Uncharacterized protein n=1 Tax=Phaseolus angularis TaxID=3914 RepID=A0A0L9VCC6_PHAAN|nr:hypothetical protein LR48_Vigan09g122100 [Vigna angularis]
MYLLKLEYSSQPENERSSGEAKVKRESVEKQVEIEVGEVKVQAVGEAEVQAEGHVEPEVEAEVEVEGEVEVEVEAVADVDVVVESEVEAVTYVDVVVKGEVEVEVEAVADVNVVVEGEVEVEAKAMVDVEPHVQVQVEGVTEVEVEVEGNGMEGQDEVDVHVDEYDVRSCNESEEDVLTDDGDEVECGIFEATNQVEIGGPRGLLESDGESESLNSVVESDNTNDDRDGYGDFGIFFNTQKYGII